LAGKGIKKYVVELLASYQTKFDTFATNANKNIGHLDKEPYAFIETIKLKHLFGHEYDFNLNYTNLKPPTLY